MKTLWRFIFLSTVLISSQILFTQDAFLDAPAIAAYSHQTRKSKSKSGQYEGVDSWKPYFTHISNVQNEEEKAFTQFSVGIGFIYFSNVKGDTSLNPAPPNSVTANTNTKKVGGFSYNRTPLYDMTYGFRILDWLKVGIGFQNQNNIQFQSMFAPSLVPTGASRAGNPASLPSSQFRANIALNTVYFKAMFELPMIMVLKSWMYALYLNAGVGPCWQSWTDIRQYIQYTTNGLETTFVNTMHQKYGASALWQIDAGIRAKSAAQSSTVSFILGCKFNSWGKIPNIGDASQQSAWGFSFRKPYTARMLYSFAPYIGVQWNF